MPIRTIQNALSTSAEEVFVPNSGVRYREITNSDSSIAIYIGSSTAVTTGNGHLLAAGKSIGFEGEAAKGSIWAIGASGTPNITMIEW